MKNKLTSRKFWVAIISIITGILGILNCDDNIIIFVGSALTVIIPTVVYIITEGKVDSDRITASAQELLKLIEELLDKLNNSDNTPKENDNILSDETKNNDINDNTKTE